MTRRERRPMKKTNVINLRLPRLRNVALPLLKSFPCVFEMNTFQAIFTVRILLCLR